MSTTDLPIESADAILAGRLPWEHKDPFDRVIVAQALRRNLTIATRDKKILEAAMTPPCKPETAHGSQLRCRTAEGQSCNEHYSVTATTLFERIWRPSGLRDARLCALRRAVDAGSSEAAAAHGYSRAAFYLVAAAFDQSGMAGLLDERRGRRGPVKLRPEIVDFIRTDTGSGAQIAEQVADRFGVRLHRRTIERVRGR
jgi:hypothetical protein